MLITSLQTKENLDSLLGGQLSIIQNDLLKNFEFFIAGGSARKSLMGQELGDSDIDLFFTNKKECLGAGKLLASTGCRVTFHPNCQGYVIKKHDHKIGTDQGITIQLITMKFYSNMQQLFDDFDFTVCQFGYSKNKYYHNENSLLHERQKLLQFIPNNQKPELTRYLKYVKLGYSPSVGAFSTMFTDHQEVLKYGSHEIDEWASLYQGL